MAELRKRSTKSDNSKKLIGRIRKYTELCTSHKVVYGFIAVLYIGSSMGVEKTVISVFVAAGYAMLAMGGDAGH